MRKYIVIALLSLGLAGCPDERGDSSIAGNASAPVASAARATSGFFAPRSAVASFPDRGELLSYDRSAGPASITGADRSYAVDISESHAIAAIANGEMRLSAPDGSLLRLRYLRHIEHADGNWTWIGRLPGADNEDAILTFGEHAVYGSIPQGNGLPPLRVTMSNGRTLITATDPRLAAKFGNGIKRPTKPDYFLPPAAIARAARDGAMQKDGVQVAQGAQNEKAVTTIDIAAGYTPGFRDSPGIGGDSQARTRLQFLIDVGNLAMSNSQVTAQLRLVNAMLVNYPDATDNGDALEKLTGFRAPSTQTTPAAEFSALRASRDQFGADLVTLVRRFRTPENSGCGIAWIIGGGQSNIGNGSDFFGYSVVSDGTDTDEGDGKNYFCRDETLVHEFGHNLGAQHDVATARGDDGVLDADEYGRFPYSFGYKTTAATGNFFTVMAYGDSGQIPHRIFSNPRVSTCGPSPGTLPCGVTDQADNARGLAQTAPLIAAFRATVVAPPGGTAQVRNDVDADGKSDLLWSRQSPGQFVAWRMNGATLAGTRSYATSTTFKAIGSGDLDGNGYADIVWIDTATGDVYAWLGQSNGTYVSRLIYRLGTSWTLAGTGDVNGDGKDDLLWSRPSTGQYVYWLMNGGVLAGSRGFAISTALTSIGTGDLDGNGRVDVLWRDAGGNIQAWLGGTDGAYTVRAVYTLATSWTLIGTGDVNKDGKDDLLWSRPASGQFVHWLMNGATIAGSAGFTVSNTLTGIGSGDFDGNGRVDLVWRNSAGDTYFWLGQGSSYTQAFVYRLTGWTLLR